MRNYLGSYEDLIVKFLQKGYEVITFASLKSTDGQLILRHDIDFDCSLANKMSFIEDKLGVKATYFFMLRSDLYNLFSDENIGYVKSIKERGHKVSLHFDPIIYDDFKKGFSFEKKVFEQIIDTKIEVVSLHRPNDFFLRYNRSMGKVKHTYQDIFFKDIKYISDSQGSFRYGHPLETEEFMQQKTIQLLIHPIWWMTKGDNNLNIIKNYINYHHKKYDENAAKHCIVYRNYMENLEKKS